MPDPIARTHAMLPAAAPTTGTAAVVDALLMAMLAMLVKHQLPGSGPIA